MWIKISLKFVLNGLFDNISALVQDRWQAIIWNNAGLVYWRIKATKS